MANPYFTNVIDLLPATKARAGDVEANFNSVEVGFDRVRSDIEPLVASFASIDLSVSTARTAADVAVGAANYNGDYSAVVTYLQGQSVSYLGDRYAAKKTNLGITPVNGADWLLIPNPLGIGGGTVNLPAALTAVSAPALLINATNHGQAITLPDATTLPNAGVPVFSLNNPSGYFVLIQDFTGVGIGFIPPSTTVGVSLTSKSTAAGSWSLTNAAMLGMDANASLTLPASFVINTATQIYVKVITLDASRSLLVMSSANSVQAVAYDASTDSFGPVVLVRTAAINENFLARLVATNQALVVSVPSGGTAMQGVVLSVSGVTVTVNTAASVTLATAFSQGFHPFGRSAAPQDYEDGGLVQLQAGSYVFAYNRATANNVIRAISVSGTTVTIGAADATLTGTSFTQTGDDAPLYRVSDTVVLSISFTSGTAVYSRPYSVSGTTLTAGTEATSTGIGNGRIVTRFNGTRWFVVSSNPAGNSYVGIVVSVAGTTATASAAVTVQAAGSFIPYAAHIVGTQLIVAGSNFVNVLTDSAGTAVAGTSLTLGENTPYRFGVTVNGLQLLASNLGSPERLSLYTVAITGNNPSVTQRRVIQGSFFDTTNTGAGNPVGLTFDATRSGVGISGRQEVGYTGQVTGPLTGWTRIGIGPIGRTLVWTGQSVTLMEQFPFGNESASTSTPLARQSASLLWTAAILPNLTSIQLRRVRAI